MAINKSIVCVKIICAIKAKLHIILSLINYIINLSHDRSLCWIIIQPACCPWIHGLWPKKLQAIVAVPLSCPGS